MHIDTDFWIGAGIFVLVVALVGVCIVYRDLPEYMRDNGITVSEFFEDFGDQHEDFWDYRAAKNEAEAIRLGTVYAEQEEWREIHPPDESGPLNITVVTGVSAKSDTGVEAWGSVDIDAPGIWEGDEPKCEDIPDYNGDPDWVRDCKKYFSVGLRRCLILRLEDGFMAQRQCYCDYRPNHRYPDPYDYLEKCD